MDVWSCGIILFTLLCGYLPFDDQNVTALFKKIRVGYFKIPTYLSQEVADLVMSMLVVNPVKRITIQQIKDDEWFQQDLPEQLFPQSDQENTSDMIDPVVINEVCQKLGVKMEEVVIAIQSGDPHNQLNVAYHLVLDNRAMGHPEATSSMPTTECNSTIQSKALSSIKKPYKPPKPHAVASVYIICMQYTLPDYTLQGLIPVASGHSITELPTGHNGGNIPQDEFLLEDHHSLSCTGEIQFAK